MACCLTASSDYLNQCWLIISKVEWHSYEDKFTRDTSAINHWNYLENVVPKISFKFPRGQWVNPSIVLTPIIARSIFKWARIADGWRVGSVFILNTADKLAHDHDVHNTLFAVRTQHGVCMATPICEGLHLEIQHIISWRCWGESQACHIEFILSTNGDEPVYQAESIHVHVPCFFDGLVIQGARASAIMVNIPDSAQYVLS